MSDSIALAAQKREVTGKKVKALRAEGFVPATIYQKGKESVNVRLEYQPFLKAYAAAGMGQPVELDVEGEKRLAMIKDVHMDPAKNTVMHVAFHAVRADRVVEAEIPVHIEGDVPAEQQGNFIVRPNDTVLVKALPADLPETLNVSAEKLVEPGDHITVADIAAVDKVEFVSEPETVLATVEAPRVEEEPEEEEVVDAADVPSDHGDEKSEEEGDSEESKDEE